MLMYNVDNHVVRTDRRLSPWMPGLALAIAKAFFFKPGQIFFADLLGGLKNKTEIFPPTMTTLAKQMRLTRLLETPIAIDDLMLSLETRAPAGAKRRMYEKTKIVMLDPTTPIDPARDGPATEYTMGRSVAEVGRILAPLIDRQTDTALTASTAHQVVPAPSHDFTARLAAMEQRIEALESQLLVDGVPPVSAPDRQTLFRIERLANRSVPLAAVLGKYLPAAAPELRALGFLNDLPKD